MKISATLTLVSISSEQGKKFVVSGVGHPAFWPHDGDIICENDIPWLREKKGWDVVIIEPKNNACEASTPSA